MPRVAKLELHRKASRTAKPKRQYRRRGTANHAVSAAVPPAAYASSRGEQIAEEVLGDAGQVGRVAAAIPSPISPWAWAFTLLVGAMQAAVEAHHHSMGAPLTGSASAQTAPPAQGVIA